MASLASGCELATSGIPADCARETCESTDAGETPPPVIELDAGVMIELDAGADGGVEECPFCPVDGEDFLPPEFDGVQDTEEISPTECLLEWEPARDDRSGRAEIRYEVFAGEPRRGFDFTRPIAITEPGATQAVVTFPPRARVDVIVRAVDAAGNRDANTRARTCDLR